MPEDLESLRRQLTSIIADEIRIALRGGPTDGELVAVAVEARATVLIDQLAPHLAKAEVRNIIRRMLKRTELKPEDAINLSKQIEFADMDEFRGIPPQVTYHDRPGHVTYIPYLDTFECERAAALMLLEKSMAADAQTYHALKSGNAFASRLVALYGDLPLWDLYRKYRDDQRKARGAS